MNVVKQREIPLELEQLEALVGRLPPNHLSYEKVDQDFLRMRSSVRGEREIEFALQFLDKSKYLILNNLRLADNNGYFQIDSLLLHKSFIVILEVKNWYGTVFFGENGQVTRVGDTGNEQGFPNPIPQAKLQKLRLRKWLNLYGFIDPVIDYFVVISFPTTIIKSSSAKHSIPSKVIHNSDLLFRILSLEDDHNSSTYNMQQLQQLSNDLIQAHTPVNRNILDKYQLSKGELIKGVFCPYCIDIQMTREKQTWYCAKCHNTSANAHYRALNDYKLLIDDYISNREARDFLQVQSPDVVKYMLQRAGFKKEGNTSNTIYQLDYR